MSRAAQALIGFLALGAASAIGAGILVAIWQYYLHLEAKGEFDSKYSRAESEYSGRYESAHNNFINVIPNNILQENGPAQWAALNRIFSGSAKIVEGFYDPLAQCLISQTCVAGDTAGEVCKRAIPEWNAYANTVTSLGDVKGINLTIGASGDTGDFGDAFGPQVTVPGVPNLATIVSQVCGVSIKSDPANEAIGRFFAPTGKDVEDQREARRRQWDAALCPAFFGVLDAALRSEDLRQPSTRFPQKAECSLVSHGGNSGNIIFKCIWPNVVVNREKFASGLMANGPLTSYRDYIDQPISDCLAKGATAVAKPTSDDDKICPDAAHAYKIRRLDHDLTITTLTEACDDLLEFHTKMAVSVEGAK